MEMDRERNLQTVARYIQKMPSLPTSVTKVIELSNDPNVSPADLNHVISLDPVLMGKVMKLINSAYYGLNQKVTSLVRAIIMLGINTVKNLALSTAVLGSIGKDSSFQALNLSGFWSHSLCVGVTSKLIAEKMGISPKERESFFVAGLLHDLGKIPLNNTLSELYIQAMGLSDRENLPLFRSEYRVIGFTHAEAGKLIAKVWKLGEEIHDALTYHHSYTNYQGPFKNIVYAVAAANYFANIYDIGFSGNRYPEPITEEALSHLGITMEWLEDTEEEVHREIDKARIFLKIEEQGK
ncbi:MAG: HDOD domain-containing protein [Spirochaetaceae bacterium]